MPFTSVSNPSQASSTGTATLTWPDGPRTGAVWLGSITVPDALPNSVNPILWTAYSGGNFAGSWYANQSSGLLRFDNSLKVVGTGIAAGQLTAYFVGDDFPAQAAPFAPPSPTPAPPPAAPFVLANVTQRPVVAGSSDFLISNAAVVIGTGLEINLNNNAGGNPLRIIVQWNAGNAGTYSFDIASGQSISGLILPNLGTAVSVQINVPVSGPTTFYTAQIITGLAPVYSPPMVEGGLLLAYNAATPNGATALSLLPYAGPVIVSLHAYNSGAGNPAASSVDAQFEAADYQGNTSQIGQVLAALQESAGEIYSQPQPFNIPPQIVTATIFNRNAFVVNVQLGIVVGR